MGNRAYFILLAVLLLAVPLAGWLLRFGWKQWIWAGAALVFYLWCKDVFAGTGWRAKPALAHLAAPGERFDYSETMDEEEAGSGRQYDFSTEELAKLPELSTTERAGYQELVGLCVAAEDQADALNFVAQLKDFGHARNHPTTLGYVRDASDAEGWYFIMGLDWKAPLADLQFLLKTALWPHGLGVAWPDLAAYAPRASVSCEGVWAGFDRSLRAVGWQLGFLDTDADEYVFVLHRVADAPRVSAAVGHIGYRYFTA